MRIVNGREIVISPAAAERPGAPQRRPQAIVVSRATRPAPPRDPARDPLALRGQLVDILV